MGASNIRAKHHGLLDDDSWQSLLLSSAPVDFTQGTNDAGAPGGAYDWMPHQPSLTAGSLGTATNSDVGINNGSGGTSVNVAASGVWLIDGLLSGAKWSNSSITYSNPDNANDYQAGYLVDRNGNSQSAQNEGFGQISAAQLLAVHYALNHTIFTQPAGAAGFSVEGFTNLGIDVGTTGSGTATIRVANTSDNATGWTFYPANSIYGGDSWLGTAIQSPAQGNYAWNNTLHELGHALGLKHGHETGGPANEALPGSYDSLEYTIMTYRSYIGGPTTGYTNEDWGYPQTYMMLDIQALQYMYGPDFDTSSGDSYYTWSPSTGQGFINGQLATNTGSQNRVFETIWDGGGIDTYDFSNYNVDLYIDLVPGNYTRLSSTQLAYLGDGHYARGNIFNALQYNNDPRSLIENAYGGTGNDYFNGNAADNTFGGRQGNNTFIGGAGFNSVIFLQNRSSYTLADTPNGLTVVGPDGHDTLTQIQQLKFADVTIVDDQFGDFYTTGTIAAGGSVAGSLEYVGDHDWFAVNLIAGHHYVVEQRGAPSNSGTLSDSYLRLYFGAITQVAVNDDSGIGRNSELGVVVSTSGVYYIDAGAFSNASSGTYTVSFLDLGTSTDRFSAPTLAVSNFGANQGWTSQDTYPRQIALFNGDDTGDIVAFGAAGTYVALGNGIGFGNPNLVSNNFGTQQGWSNQDSYPRLLADANGDGQIDLVGFGIAGTYVALGNGSTFGSANLVLANYGSNQGWTSENTYVRELGDVNGDGKADIVAFGIAGTYVSLATSGGNFANPSFVLSQFGTNQGWSTQDKYPRVLADVNGDHKADIIGFGADGVFVSLATNGGSFAPLTQEISNFGFNNGWTSGNTYPRAVADVNSDGMADVVGFGTSGIYVSLATGGGHFAAAVQTGANMGTSTGWASEDAFPRLLGDVTGDQRADAVGFGIAGTYISQSHHDWLVA